MLVREPDQLGLERANELLALGVGLIELAEPHRYVAGDDNWSPRFPRTTTTWLPPRVWPGAGRRRYQT